MSEWREVKLSEIADVIDSLHQTPQYVPQGKPMVRVTDIKKGYLDLSNTLRVSEDVYTQFSQKHKASKGDILFSRVGSYGTTCYVNSNDEFCLGQNTAFIVPKENSLFLYYYFNSPLGINEIEAAVAGSTQPTVSLKSINNFSIVLPSPKEQQAIAAVLSSLDDKIDLLHRQNATLEAIAEALFRQWFVVEEKEEWAVGTLSSLITVRSEFAFKSSSFIDSGKFKLVTIKAVQDGFLSLENADLINDIPQKMPNYCLIKAGDILLSLTGNVGRCCIVDTDGLLLNQRVAILEPIDKKDWALTYILFRQSSMKSSLEDLAKGTAQANLSPVETAAMPFTFPPRDLLNIYSEEATPLLKKFLSNRYQIRTLEKLRDTLLPKLMSGEVRIAS